MRGPADACRSRPISCRPRARRGYFDYTSGDHVFTMEPTGPGLEARRKGLGGEARGVCEERRAPESRVRALLSVYRDAAATG